MTIAISGAATVEVVAADGTLRPGVPSVVWVAAVDEWGNPVATSKVDVVGGTIRPLPEEHPVGLTAWTVVPAPDAEGVEVTVTVANAATTRRLPVSVPPASHLVFPKRVVGSAGSSPVHVRVTGDDLPPPGAVMAWTSEGRVGAVAASEGMLDIEILPDDNPFPRSVLVALRDTRRDEQPAVGAVTLVARPRLPLQVEPGTTAHFSVGEREYGPFVADEDGALSATIDQYPGELVAQVTLQDDLGNQTRTEFPLSSHPTANLLAVPSGSQRPGRVPWMYVYASQGDSGAWSGPEPVCRAPGMRELESIALRRGAWMVPLPAELLDARITCALASAASTSLRVPVATLPARLQVRVWPQDLSTDFPVADVSVSLEDLRGERIGVEGVHVSAGHGEVRLEEVAGTVARGVYDGGAAVAHGSDVIRARYHAPPGTGPVVNLRVAYGTVPVDGDMVVFGRALDGSGRPLEGIELQLSAGDEAATARTGADGWASATVGMPPGLGPLHLSARTAERQAHGLALRGSQGPGGPAVADLRDQATITLSPGTVENIEIAVDPAILYAGQRSVALVRVTLLDRARRAVTDEAVLLDASEGAVGPVRLQDDGSFVAEYTPVQGITSPREVVLTARIKSTGRASSTRMEVLASPVNGAVGLFFGAITNFGQVNPTAGVHADLRTPWFGRTVMMRFGAGQHWVLHDLTDFDVDTRIRLAVYSVRVGPLLRRDDRGRAAWIGAQAVLAPYWVQLKVDDQVVGSGLGLLPGAALVAGVGLRAGFGEVVLEVETLGLTSPRGDLEYRGTVGGVSGWLAYRIVY